MASGHLLKLVKRILSHIKSNRAHQRNSSNVSNPQEEEEAAVSKGKKKGTKLRKKRWKGHMRSSSDAIVVEDPETTTSHNSLSISSNPDLIVFPWDSSLLVSDSEEMIASPEDPTFVGMEVSLAAPAEENERAAAAAAFILSQRQEAALKIQTLFRGYLARRALKALKAIVKVQALIRGLMVRRRRKSQEHNKHGGGEGGHKQEQEQEPEQEQEQEQEQGHHEAAHEHDDDDDDGGGGGKEFNVVAISSSDCNNDATLVGLPCKSSDDKMSGGAGANLKKMPLKMMMMMMVPAVAASASIHVNNVQQQQQQQEQLQNYWASQSNNNMNDNSNQPLLSFRAWIEQPCHHHHHHHHHHQSLDVDDDGDDDDGDDAKIPNSHEFHDPHQLLNQRRNLGHILSVAPNQSSTTILPWKHRYNPHPNHKQNGGRPNKTVNYKERITLYDVEGPYDHDSILIPVPTHTPPKNDHPSHHGSSRNSNLMKPNYMIPTKSAEAKVVVRSNECFLSKKKSKKAMANPTTANHHHHTNNNSGRLKYSWRHPHNSSSPTIRYNIVNALSESLDSRRTNRAAAFIHSHPASHNSSNSSNTSNTATINIINHRLPNNMPLFRSYNEGAGRPLQHRRPFYV